MPASRRPGAQRGVGILGFGLSWRVRTFSYSRKYLTSCNLVVEFLRFESLLVLTKCLFLFLLEERQAFSAFRNPLDSADVTITL
jgi:hypothetical protein